MDDFSEEAPRSRLQSSKSYETCLFCSILVCVALIAAAMIDQLVQMLY